MSYRYEACRPWLMEYISAVLTNKNSKQNELAKIAFVCQITEIHNNVESSWYNIGLSDGLNSIKAIISKPISPSTPTAYTLDGGSVGTMLHLKQFQIAKTVHAQQPRRRQIDLQIDDFSVYQKVPTLPEIYGKYTKNINDEEEIIKLIYSNMVTSTTVNKASANFMDKPMNANTFGVANVKEHNNNNNTEPLVHALPSLMEQFVRQCRTELGSNHQYNDFNMNHNVVLDGAYTTRMDETSCNQSRATVHVNATAVSTVKSSEANACNHVYRQPDVYGPAHDGGGVMEQSSPGQMDHHFEFGGFQQGFVNKPEQEVHAFSAPN